MLPKNIFTITCSSALFNHFLFCSSPGICPCMSSIGRPRKQLQTPQVCAVVFYNYKIPSVTKTRQRLYDFISPIRRTTDGNTPLLKRKRKEIGLWIRTDLCGSGSSIFPYCGSGSSSKSRVLMTKNWQKFVAVKLYIFRGDREFQFTYSWASIKDAPAQAAGEAFSSQKRTSSTSKHKFFTFFYFFVLFLPSWIRIRIQQL